MYLKKTKQKNDRVRLDVVENYYDSWEKKSKQVTLKSLGYVDDLEKIYDDPISHFKKVILDYKGFIQNSNYPITLKFQNREEMNDMRLHERNFGFVILSKIYHGLELHKFLLNKQRHRNDTYNADELFKILLNSQIISKYDRTSWFQKKKQYTKSELKSFFNFMSSNSFNLLKWTNNHIKDYYNRGSCYIYENITEFNFTENSIAEIAINKNNIYNQTRNSIYMSLYLDSHGVPYAFREVNKFNHNDNPKKFYDKLQDQLNIKNFVIVGDRIVKSYEELDYEIKELNNNKYVFAIDPITAPLEMQNFILNSSDIKQYNKETMYKTRIYPREIILDNGSKKIILEKQLFLKNSIKETNDRFTRENMLSKVSKIISNPHSFNVCNLSDEIKYIKKLSFNPDGTINMEDSILELDKDRILLESKYDGIKCLITNEPKNNLTHIIQVYYYQYSLEKVLANIKCTIQRFSKFFNQEEYTDYTTTILMVTYTSLIMIRLLHLAMEKKYSLETLLDAINKYNCILIQQNYYLFTYYDDVLAAIGKRMNIDLNVRIRTLKEIRQIFAKIKKTDFTDPEQTKPAE